MTCHDDQRTGVDYSEEAIPERDPAYRLPDGTLYETKTIEYISNADRLALVRCLEQLGMSPARAAMVVSLGLNFEKNLRRCRFPAFPNDYQVRSTFNLEPINQKENAIKYMLLVYTNENAWTDSEREKCFAESTQLTHELHARGQYLGASIASDQHRPDFWNLKSENCGLAA